MKRFFIAVSCFAILMMSYGAFAKGGPDSLELPTGTMTLTAPFDTQRSPKLSPVLFPHSLHFSYSCKDCHHDWDGENPVKSCATSGCHEKIWAPMPGTTPLDGKRIKSLTGAYHQVCRSCHRREVTQQKNAGIKNVSTGPIACEGCHPTPHSEVENSHESLSIPLGNMTISAPDEVDAKRGSVEFPHGLHFDFACQSCHHDWDGESEVENCTASGCHDETEASGSRNIKDPDNVLYYLAAYHNVCVECHRDLGKQVKTLEDKGVEKDKLPKTGPVGCVGCHS